MIKYLISWKFLRASPPRQEHPVAAVWHLNYATWFAWHFSRSASWRCRHRRYIPAEMIGNLHPVEMQMRAADRWPRQNEWNSLDSIVRQIFEKKNGNAARTEEEQNGNGRAGRFVDPDGLDYLDWIRQVISLTETRPAAVFPTGRYLNRSQRRPHPNRWNCIRLSHSTVIRRVRADESCSPKALRLRLFRSLDRRRHLSEQWSSEIFE